MPAGAGGPGVEGASGESKESGAAGETGGTTESGRAGVSSSRPRTDFAYLPPSNREAAPHLQVLPDVARTWLPWAAATVGGVAALMLVLRWLRSR